MNKGIIAVGIIVLVLIGGVLIITNQQSQQAEQAKMTQEKDGNKMVKTSSSRYIVYSKGAYDQAVNKRRVLYFYATWCPSCKQANEDFTANPDKIPEDVIVLRVNYNDPDTDSQEKDFAKKYGITYQHTFVQIDEQGKELTKWNGGKTDELVANIK